MARLPAVEAPALRVGLISDTHGLLRPEAKAALSGVDLILHGGDIGGPAILEELADVAPVHAVRGNNDRGPFAEGLPDLLAIELGGARIVMVHDRADLPSALGDADVIVTGHSHQPRVEDREGALFVNPGSAGPRRFRLPIAVGELCIVEGKVRARIVELLTR